MTSSRRPNLPPPGPPVAPGELLVGSGGADVAVAALGGYGIGARPEPIAGADVVRLHLDPPPPARSIPTIVRALRRDRPGLVVSPNRLLRPASHMHTVGVRPPRPAPPLAALPTGPSLPGRGVTVGVVDSGFCPDPWFGDRVEARPEDLEGPPSGTAEVLPRPTGHGTFVAGIVLQHAPGARIVARRVIDDHGHVSDASLAAALADMEGVDVLNLSLGTGAVDRDDAVALLATANSLFKLWKKNPDLVVVAPAGNDGRDEHFWPARFDPVVAVAALAADDSGPAPFSNHGDWVDACARGEDVHSRFLHWEGDVEGPGGERQESEPFAGWARWDGTSFATARVSGAIAAAFDRAGKGGAHRVVDRVLSGPAPHPGFGSVVA